MQAWGADDPSHTSLGVKVAAAATAGTIGSAIANPTDVVMIRMQAPVTIAGTLLWRRD